jgi:hypothetical protein
MFCPRLGQYRGKLRVWVDAGQHR